MSSIEKTKDALDMAGQGNVRKIPRPKTEAKREAPNVPSDDLMGNIAKVFGASRDNDEVEMRKIKEEIVQPNNAKWQKLKDELEQNPTKWYYTNPKTGQYGSLDHKAVDKDTKGYKLLRAGQPPPVSSGSSSSLKSGLQLAKYLKPLVEHIYDNWPSYKKQFFDREEAEVEAQSAIKNPTRVAAIPTDWLWDDVNEIWYDPELDFKPTSEKPPPTKKPSSGVTEMTTPAPSTVKPTLSSEEIERLDKQRQDLGDKADQLDDDEEYKDLTFRISLKRKLTETTNNKKHAKRNFKSLIFKF